MNGYNDCGVIYVAAGEQFVEEARQSAQSINKHCSDIKITLFTDIDCSPPEFDSTRKIADPEFGSIDKVKSIRRTPYARTLYIDCDTYICDINGIFELFDLLEEFDVAAAHDTSRTAPVDGPLKEEIDHSVPETFPMFNGGLIAFRSSPAVNHTFEDWLVEYRSHLGVDENAPDQESLRAALYRSDLRVATIPPEYNFRIPYRQLVYGKVKILHGRADNFNQLSEEVNKGWKKDRSRLYVPAYVGGKGLSWKSERVYPIMNPAENLIPAMRARMSIIEYGLIRTIIYFLLGGLSDGKVRFDIINESVSERGVLPTLIRLLRWKRKESFS